MRTHETIEIKGAVVVAKQALDEMNRVMEQIAASLGTDPTPTPIYSGLLSDGTKVEFDSFSELVGYPNRTSRRLTRVEAKLVTEKEPAGKARIFNLEVVVGGPTPCVISIDGEQRHTLHARELMQDIIERIRAGYSWMYKGSVDAFAGVLFVSCLLGAPLVWFIGYESDGDHQRKVDFAADLMKINPASETTKKAVSEAKEPAWNHTFWGIEYWLWLLLSAAVVFLIFLMRDLLWPRVVFEIGQEIDRSNARKDRRKWIVVSLVLAIPVALLSRFIGTRLGL